MNNTLAYVQPFPENCAQKTCRIIISGEPGDRRWGLPAEFPLEDSEGFLVPVDRRRLPNRVKAGVTLEDVETLLSQFSVNDTDR
jgi:hypothetical protein